MVFSPPTKNRRDGKQIMRCLVVINPDKIDFVKNFTVFDTSIS
jgi:hypothetical protein